VERAEAPAATKREERRAAGVACGAHAMHDGYTDLIYVMLPLWQAEFGIGYAALGLLRTCYSGTMASLQIPSALLSERLGVPLVLAGGTALAGLGYQPDEVREVLSQLPDDGPVEELLRDALKLLAVTRV